MKKVIVIALGIALIGASGSAFADCMKVWDDLSWWAQSGATPGPVKDPVRSGYWWWPTQPASNAGDAELWGNRGVVYAQYTPPAPPTPTPAPPAAPPAVVTRKVPVLNHVLFDFDKSVLKPEGKAASDTAVNWLKKYPQDTVTIVGHTCNIGTDEYNMKLGQRRANSVKDYLLDSGIAASRVTAISKGESEPAVPNSSPANRKLNRRAVFEISLGD